MAETVQDEVREIKKSLRLAMNGVVSTLQRRQGLNYKINFGVEIPRLKGIALEVTVGRSDSFVDTRRINKTFSGGSSSTLRKAFCA